MVVTLIHLHLNISISFGDSVGSNGDHTRYYEFNGHMTFKGQGHDPDTLEASYLKKKFKIADQYYHRLCNGYCYFSHVKKNSNQSTD